MSYANNFKHNGVWQEFYIGQGVKVATKAYKLHRTIISRISKFKNKIYIGCSMSEEFKDFQFFAEWCSEQIGYGNVDANNRSWVIDKDLLFKGNMVYSQTTCCFIPVALNTLITKQTNKASKLPPGVSTLGKHYVASCKNSEGKSVTLLISKSIPACFQAYKHFKEDVIKQRALQYKNVIDPRVFNSLMSWEIDIEDYKR